MSDSDTSSQGGAEYKTFRQITRDRLLYEMLRSVKSKDTKATWKVLIMDKLTVKIMSNSCKMADITDEGVSLVEDLYKRRQPMPAMDAVYFMQPLKDNIMAFLSDMSGKKPLYKKAYVFFSSPVSKELLSHIKTDHSALARIGALSEINLEYSTIDNQGFITDNERALEELFAESAEHSHKYSSCINTMAVRIATVFASLREFPYVRYQAAKSSFDASVLTTIRDLVPTKLAAEIWNCLAKYRTTIPNFPQRETCELLIVDRSVDLIAPIIHEWTYDAMCHDLLGLEGNKYVQEVLSKSGSVERKEVLLEEHDPVWLELRHAHIADASERLHDKMTNFMSNNTAAQIHLTLQGGGELSTRDMQKIVRDLPDYGEQIDKISLHVEIAGKINKMIRELGLKDIGQLEQDLAFGNAGTKAVIEFLRKNQDASDEIKLRLMMIYAAINPENFESDKGAKLLQLAKLSDDDAIAVNNMKWLRHTVKKSSGGFALKFHKKKHGVRKERKGEDEQWVLSKFYTMIEELIDKLNKSELPKDEYQCMNESSPTIDGTTQSASVTSSPVHPAHSVRSRRTPTWARPRASDDGHSSDSGLKDTSNDFRRMGQRIFVFIIGGATRSELRAVHKLTSKLKREIILGSTSLDDPAHFIKKVKLLSAENLSLDALEI